MPRPQYRAGESARFIKRGQRLHAPREEQKGRARRLKKPARRRATPIAGDKRKAQAGLCAASKNKEFSRPRRDIFVCRNTILLRADLALSPWTAPSVSVAGRGPRGRVYEREVAGTRFLYGRGRGCPRAGVACARLSSPPGGASPPFLRRAVSRERGASLFSDAARGAAVIDSNPGRAARGRVMQMSAVAEASGVFLREGAAGNVY